MKTLHELKPLILKWAHDKDLLKNENANYQYLKLIEEVGETAKAILEKNNEKAIDGIGDIFVVLVIYYEQTGQCVSFDFFKPQKPTDYGTCLYGIIGHARNEFQNENVFDWLNDLAFWLGYDLTECANIAWNEIKDRTGKTVNGTFIKN